ncbi:AAA-like domain-containing protein [Paraburkholderia sp. MM5482-R1]|uniref:AAA-like domain-containing protein n=1 Tax=unclassified Paraburkholderia TaxID=2615204 RepID=UPI003D1EC77F
MNKKLKSLTIIPESLYVRRDADRQVKQIIDDMGRPGYVLVARQMGKTNLLLNARRELATNGDRFVFVDVSNIFPSLREFFRNIVDTALSVGNFPSDVWKLLDERRTITGRFPEHKEHEAELAFLIDQIDGKLVVCLDEIDALTKTIYSDNVFSFIRSVYFSGRTNVDQFSRLTYLLSGVAEPTELIKNKNISPFNIGAKIYLEDFSVDELRSLASRTDVAMPSDVVDRVFAWSSGHPRISWDLLSRIEDVGLKGFLLTPDAVDVVVREAYLTSFDLPPVDNIRRLVEDDREIRDAIMAIHYDRSESLTSVVRSRLYLNGIVASQQVAGPVQLRNKIIEAALSEDWLRDVEHRKLSANERADAAFSREDYEQAVKYYLEFLETKPERTHQLLVYSHLGVCYLRMRRYEEALQYLELDPITRDDALMGYLYKRFNTGVVLMYLGKADDAKVAFEEVAELSAKAPSKEFLLEAILNCAAIESESVANTASVLSRCNSVLAQIELGVNDESTSPQIVRLRLAAYYLIYKAHLNNQELDLAEIGLQKAADIAEGGDKITLLSTLANLTRDVAKKKSTLDQCIALIGEIKPQIKEATPTEQFAMTEERFETLLFSVIELGEIELTERLLDYLDSSSVDFVQARRIIYLAGFRDTRGFKQGTAPSFLRAVADRFQHEAATEMRRTFLQILAAIEPGNFDRRLANDLVELTTDATTPLTAADVRISFESVRAIATHGSSESAAQLLEALERRVTGGAVEYSELVQTNGVWPIMADMLRFNLSVSTGNQKDSLFYAKALMERASKLDDLRPKDFFKQSELAGWIREVRAYIAKTPLTPIKRTAPKFGRNDLVTVRLKTGEILQGKFKRFEEIIESGDGEIVLL